MIVTWLLSACSSYGWPAHRNLHPDKIFFVPRCSWNEPVMTAQLEDGCVVRSTIFCALLLFTRVSCQQPPTTWLIPTPAARRRKASRPVTNWQLVLAPQSALTLQANNLLFANCESITNAEVSVSPSPAQLLSITSGNGACCIDLTLISFLFLVPWEK